MSKNFSRFLCFVGGVYLRDYPNPYLYTHAGPIGDIGLLALPACRRAPYTLPYTYYFFFFFSLSACRVVVGVGSPGTRSPAAAAASTIPINRNMCIVDNLAVQLQVFPRDFLTLLLIFVLSCCYLLRFVTR